ncbi:MAG: hypothetical protein ACLFNU_02510 [Bacteroidales bacterium]
MTKIVEIKLNLFTSIAKRIALLAILIAVLHPTNCLAGFPEEQPGSRAAGLAYSATSLTDSWSLFYNQAGLGHQENIWVGAHHENRFFTPELNFSAIGALLPVKSGALGLSIKRMGFSEFNQTKIGLAYGMKLAPTLSAGVQLNTHYVYIAGEYGSAAAFTAEGGLIYSPTEDLSVGFHFINPTRTKLYEEERIPTLINLGISYQLGDMVLVTSGVEKNLDANFTYKAGVEFKPIDNLYLRTGMATDPSLFSFGLGYKIRSIQMDLAFTHHEILGYTPHFSISYRFGEKSNGQIPEED